MRTPRSEIPRLLELSRDRDPKVRRKAIAALCRCEVKMHDSGIWNRLLEMADDPDPHVRRWIVHVLCDGSPGIYEARILGVLESLRNDADERGEKVGAQGTRGAQAFRDVEHPLEIFEIAHDGAWVADAGRRNARRDPSLRSG